VILENATSKVFLDLDWRNFRERRYFFLMTKSRS
jgi:hypothetical protein